MTKRFIFVLVIIVVSISDCTRNEASKQPHRSVLPSLYINLPPEQFDSILIDRDQEFPAEALLITADNDTLYDDYLSHIKTRGNTTFKKAEAKKSFTIKLPKKRSWLGLDKSQHFVLLANTFDDSHIRNTIAFDLAHDVGLPAPHYAYLSLYINGEYKGLYQITNKIEVSKHTLNLTNLDKLNKRANPRPLKEYAQFSESSDKQIILRKGALLACNPEDITGGYLLDLCGADWVFVKSPSGFVSDAGDYIRIRSPKYASPAEVNYIATFYNSMEAAITSDDGYNPETKKHYSEYIDTESFALVYLINELLLNQDGGLSSSFLYKDSDSIDSRLYAGPIWDFDRSIGNTTHSDLELIMPNELFVNVKHGKTTWSHSHGIFFYLCKHEDFQEMVKKLYYQKLSPSCHKYIESGTIDSLVDCLSEDADRDSRLYGTRKNMDYHSITGKTLDFLQKRLAFFDWYYSASPKDIITINFQSDQNGAHHRNLQIYYPVGEPITVVPSLKSHPKRYSREPDFELYIAGTDSIVPDNTVFNSAKTLELRYHEPTWKDAQKRRIRKKLEQWGICKPAEWEW